MPKCKVVHRIQPAPIDIAKAWADALMAAMSGKVEFPWTPIHQAKILPFEKPRRRKR